jgi:hypothetical protein
MGLLDDAIREHLELKRRHGADPDEVEQQEREALGEARRAEFAPTPDDEGVPSAPFDAAAEVPEADEPPEFEEAGAPEPELPGPGAEAAAPGYDEDPWLDEERDEVTSDEALERSFGEAEEAPGEGRDSPEDRNSPEAREDVLEETPEFLQETPEHDRLWFEQRPPKDFDWDK